MYVCLVNTHTHTEANANFPKLYSESQFSNTIFSKSWKHKKHLTIHWLNNLICSKHNQYTNKHLQKHYTVIRNVCIIMPSCR